MAQGPDTQHLLEANKAVARRLMDEVWGQGKVEVLDEIMAEDVVDHGAADASGGREAIKEAVTMIRSAFPDLHPVEVDLIAEGDKVVRRWIVSGSHLGNFLGLPPTGKPIRVTGINVDRIVDGRIVEYWHNFDMLGWLEQLGVSVPIELAASSSFAGQGSD
jgi:steroid delta-isomerase-like uncharacterized protein